MDKLKMIQDYVDSLTKNQMNDDQHAALLENEAAMYGGAGSSVQFNYTCSGMSNSSCQNMNCPGGSNGGPCYNSGGCTPSTVNSGYCSNSSPSCYYG